MKLGSKNIKNVRTLLDVYEKQQAQLDKLKASEGIRLTLVPHGYGEENESLKLTSITPPESLMPKIIELYEQAMVKTVRDMKEQLSVQVVMDDECDECAECGESLCECICDEEDEE